ncbi:hypothetical protein CEXT_552291 [Caerostris extrusa]|uniref:Uncharacterized protein n=1 Tax=Caerostris extrusa TaxID=172846 RepID=A0AAV4NKI4_CAEEX|nr:hypothetical protein CEXT_552291 [Caerostris extrusa]
MAFVRWRCQATLTEPQSGKRMSSALSCFSRMVFENAIVYRPLMAIVHSKSIYKEGENQLASVNEEATRIQSAAVEEALININNLAQMTPDRTI